MGHLAKNQHCGRSWKSLMIGLCVLALTMGSVGSAFGITLNFASVGDSQLQFVGTGDTFSFIPSTTTSPGFDFQINLSSTGPGGAVGLVGDITGTYVITGISGTGFQTGTVSGVHN